MPGLEFVNRVQELSALKRLALASSDGARVVFLRARSGVGKSGVVDQLIDTEPSLNAVRVAVLAKTGADNLSHLSHVVSRIDEYAARSGRFVRFQDFLKSSKNPAIFAETASRAAGRIGAAFAPAGVVAPLAQRMLNAEEFNAHAVILKDKSLDLVALTGYLVEFMRQPNAVLGIENIQQVDDRSLMLLTNAIQEAQSGLWILEYTDEAGGHPLDRLLVRVRATGAASQILALNPLPWSELRNSLGMQSQPGEALLAVHYDRSGGNLRDFLDARTLVEHGGDALISSPGTSATSIVLKGLPSNRAQVVALIALHDGRAVVSLLRQALVHIGARGGFAERLDLDRELTALADANIVRVGDGVVEFAHDSILRELQGLPAFDRYTPIAATAWLAVYRELRTRNDPFLSPAALSTSILFYSYYLGDEAELFTTLREIATDAVQALAPDRLTAYVRLLFGRIQASGADNADRLHKLSHQIIETLYRVGQFDSAESLLPFLQADSDVVRYYRAALSIECGRTEEALEHCARILRETRRYPKNPLRLATGLLELAALRLANRLSECHSRYLGLREDRTFEGTPFAAHLDLLAGTALPTTAAVPLLRNAEAAFVAHAQEFEANCARITLSQCLGDLGEIEEARAALDRIDASPAIASAERYSVWVNRAALDLYAGRADEAVELLRTAALAASDRFSRLLILTNLLIGHTLTDQRSSAQDVADLLRGMLEERDPAEPEIRRIAAFNLEYFYRKYAMTADAERMRVLAKAEPSQVNQPLWEFRFGSKAVAPAEYAFRMRYDYYPPLFAYWQTDLSRLLSN